MDMIPNIVRKSFENVPDECRFPLARLHSGHIAKLLQLCEVRDGRLVLSWSSSGQPLLLGNAANLNEVDRRDLLDELKALRNAVFSKGFASIIEPGVDAKLIIEIPVKNNIIADNKVLVLGSPCRVSDCGLWIMTTA
jgi:hypothetical protein